MNDKYLKNITQKVINAIQCESKYGDRQCTSIGNKMLISRGQLYSLCRVCYKRAKQQEDTNNANE